MNVTITPDLLSLLEPLSDEKLGSLLRSFVRDESGNSDDVYIQFGKTILENTCKKTALLREKRQRAIKTRWTNRSIQTHTNHTNAYKPYKPIQPSLHVSETEVIHKQNNAPRDAQRQLETHRNKTAQNSSKVIHNENDTVNYSVIQCNTPVSTRLQPSPAVSPRARALAIPITNRTTTRSYGSPIDLSKEKKESSKEKKESPATEIACSHTRTRQDRLACCSLFSSGSFADTCKSYCQSARPELDAAKIVDKFRDFYTERGMKKTEDEWLAAFRKWVEDEVSDESNSAQDVISLARLRKLATQIGNSESYCCGRYSKGTNSLAEVADRLFDYGSRYKRDFEYVVKKAISLRILKDMPYRPGFDFEDEEETAAAGEPQPAFVDMLEQLNGITRMN